MCQTKSVLRLTFAVMILLASWTVQCYADDPAPPSSSYRELMVDQADTNQAVTLEQDEMLVVRFEANPSTGYQWEVVSGEGKVIKDLNSQARGNGPEFVEFKDSDYFYFDVITPTRVDIRVDITGGTNRDVSWVVFHESAPNTYITWAKRDITDQNII